MDQYRSEVEGDSTSCLAMNACFKSDPLEMCMCRCRVMATSHVFTHKVRQSESVKDGTSCRALCGCFSESKDIHMMKAGIKCLL